MRTSNRESVCSLKLRKKKLKFQDPLQEKEKQLEIICAAFGACIGERKSAFRGLKIIFLYLSEARSKELKKVAT